MLEYMFKNSRIKSKSVFGSFAPQYYIILSLVFVVAVILIANKQQIYEGFFNNYRAEYYYMEGCHHCEQFDATWKKLIDFGGFTRITLKKFGNDSEEGKARLELMRITSFPTIVIVDNSRQDPVIIATFNEERLYEKLNKFIKKYDI